MKTKISAISTILIVRMLVTLASNTESLQFIFYDQSYHFYYGFGILSIALIFRKLKHSQIFFGIGSGLFIDDIAAIQYIGNFPKDPVGEYWSAIFIIPMLIGLLILTLSENKLKQLFLTK